MLLYSIFLLLPFSLLILAVPAPISPDAQLETHTDGNCQSSHKMVPLLNNKCYRPVGSVESLNVVQLKNGCQVWAFDNADCGGEPAILRPGECVGPLGERNDVEGLMVQCKS